MFIHGKDEKDENMRNLKRKKFSHKNSKIGEPP